jgi:SAM-dependent methyltransferase
MAPRALCASAKLLRTHSPGRAACPLLAQRGDRVLQLVPHRGRALREIHRVLRPWGTIAYVTWRVAADAPFPPDEAFYDALDDAGVPDDGATEEPRSGDVPSAEAAAAQARRAGFGRVVAREALLEHPFERARYLEFLERYAERETFEDLTEDQRRAVQLRPVVVVHEVIQGIAAIGEMADFIVDPGTPDVLFDQAGMAFIIFDHDNVDRALVVQFRTPWSA